MLTEEQVDWRAYVLRAEKKSMEGYLLGSELKPKMEALELVETCLDLFAENRRLKEGHCRDCCCARSWDALGISEHTGKSIPEEIVALREENERLSKALAAIPCQATRTMTPCQCEPCQARARKEAK